MSVKYTGSKRWLVKVLRPIEEIYEPFAGSAVISFRRSERCHLNDSISALISMYRRMQVDQEKFVGEVTKMIDTIRSSPCSSTAYYEMRSKFNRGDMLDPVMFCTILYLGFNGLYRVGPNGCNVPYGGDDRRFDPSGLLSTPVDKIASLACLPWEQAEVPNETCTIYADPPYFGAFTGYTSAGWTQADNEALFSWLANKPNPVLLSCLRSDENEKLLRKVGLDYITLSKTFSNGRGSVTKGEILAFNELSIPSIVFREVRR